MLALLVVISACIISAAKADDGHFSGTYEGHIGGDSAVLELNVSGTVVTGRIARSMGTTIELNGTLTEGRIVGAASTSRGTGFFEAYRELGALVFILSESGAVTGQTIEARAEFFAADNTIRDETTVTEQSTPAAPPRDQKLMGTWTTREYLAIGDMVLPVTSAMTLDPDGHYSRESEPETISQRGQWRSLNGFLEYRAQESAAWTALGEYQLHGNNLILVKPNTQPQLWTRAPN